MSSLLRRMLVRSPLVHRQLRHAHFALSYARHRVHEQEFLYFKRFADSSGLFVDVGGNTGQSALSFGTLCPRHRIISFEPNPALAADLRFARRLLGQRFEFHLVGLSDTSTDEVLMVPRLGGEAITGEASMSGIRGTEFDRKHGSAFTIDNISVRTITLDSLDLSPDFIKIDIQGFEMRALRGMRKTLVKHRPLVLIERTSDRVEITEFLGSMGYTVYRYNREENDLELIDDIATFRELNYFAVSALF